MVSLSNERGTFVGIEGSERGNPEFMCVLQYLLSAHRNDPDIGCSTSGLFAEAFFLLRSCVQALDYYNYNGLVPAFF